MCSAAAVAPSPRWRLPLAIRTRPAPSSPTSRRSMSLLIDAPHERTAVNDIEDAYRAYGSGAAWGKFVSLVMHDGPVTEAGVTPAAWPPAGDDTEDAQPQDDQDPDGVETPPGQTQLHSQRPFGRY